MLGTITFYFRHIILTYVFFSHIELHTINGMQLLAEITQLKGSVKEPNILICFFFCPSLNRVLFPMFCLLVEEECHILVF